MSIIGDKEVMTILEAAEKVVKAFRELPENTERKEGGFLTIANRKTGQILLVAPVGSIPDAVAPAGSILDEKVKKYFDFSQEKTSRLFLHPEHESSWESRDPKKEQWGGAIVAWDFIISFSGLPEAGDEAVSLIIAYKLNWANWGEITKIAERSGNSLFDSLHQVEHYGKKLS